MSQFNQALHLVHDALLAQQEHAGGPAGSFRASSASLRRLAEAARAQASVQTSVEAQTQAQVSKAGKPSLPGAAAPSHIAKAATATAPVPAASGPAVQGLAARVRAAMKGNTPPPGPQGGSTPNSTSGTADPGNNPAVAPDSSSGSKEERMERLRAQALACLTCSHLAASRTQVVFGVGNVDAELMFVGEAPGADEDREGEPFVGKAGQLLTKIIEAMGFRREEVYIANVLKCRPDMPPGESGNRKPRPEEMETCLPYLVEQIDIIGPKCLVALGATAMQGLLGKEAPMRELRGRWHSFKGIPLMATYHPAYLLRNQSLSEKRKVWEDMLQVLELLGKPITPKQRGYFLPKGR